MTRKVAFKTLGCRLNQFETDALVSQFRQGDYEIVDFQEDADIYIVNTCTVTNHGDAKSRKAINYATRKVSDPVTIVTGCMVNNKDEDHLRNLHGVTYFVENAQKTSIFQIVEAHYRGETVNLQNYEKDLFGFQPAHETLHTRSYIKIQDGCNNFCTFCIVPKVRGRAISRPVNDILKNISQVIDFGYKEVVLTGVNIGRYDHEGTDFESLIEKILHLPGDFRVRLSSIEPEGFGDKLFDMFQHPKFTPHLHICLQSGSDRILLLMRRFYNLKTFMTIVEKLKGRYTDFNLTTDVIVGFPGETEDDFQQTCKVVSDIGFSHIHTFKYSVRKGTRAERMPDHLPEKLKNERSEIIRQIADENKIRYWNSLIGKEQTVLVERYNERTKFAKGYGELYVPVEFTADPGCHNEFFKVKLEKLGKAREPVLLGRR